MRPKTKAVRWNRRKNLKERQEAYHHAFTLAFDCYEECVSTSGTQSYDRFYRCIAGEGSGHQGGMCVGVGLSDFLADMELAMVHALGRPLFPVVRQGDEYDRVQDLKLLTDSEKERIGKEIMHRKLSPALYFKAKRRYDQRTN